MNYNDLLGLVKERRSVRYFEDKMPSDEEIKKIIEVARWAPSAANSQPWTFVAVTDKDLKEKLFDVVGRPKNIPIVPDPTQNGKKAGMRRSFMNGALIFICIDERIGTRLNDKMKYSNMSNVTLYVHLAATSLGFGSQYVGQFGSKQNEAKVKELLKLPEDLTLFETVSVGYAAKRPGPRPVRELSEILHLNTIDKSKVLTDEEIKNYMRKTIRL